ncbi:carboxymuconolactone decarboxylase family protein [Microtetraspora malaysiensis]|uniref:carboxymuconolactone decarboxylase family protein n=1 Tax=Microtetraspora malaysiensis TaxID=161358 RepID=UPI00082BA2F7|nr:peroxidase-related enzyme [Microtetraspora malaysiensis]
MAYISLNNDAPGILGLMIYRPETAGPLNELTELLLAGDNTLSRGDRELIAAYVSRLNKCDFCGTIHGVMAARQLPGGASQVEQACTNPHAADVTPKMRALLDIAALVQQSGRAVTQEAVDAARAAGATDPEIHDTVLIAATFCMFNRYVDGLGTFAPPARADYEPMADTLLSLGYSKSIEAMQG